MTERPPLRLFVAPGSVAANRVVLAPEDARRLHGRGGRAGDTVVLLDESGWELSVTLDRAAPDAASGVVVGRRLGTERRTKVSLYQGLLHPSDFRRLLHAATRGGVVAIAPVVTEASPIAALQALRASPDAAVAEWASVVRTAAEDGGRARRPALSAPMLLDHAFDDAARWGNVVVLGPGGTDFVRALRHRPFSIGLFCPPQAGFTASELGHARSRGALVVAASGGGDPVRLVTAALRAIYASTEDEDAAWPGAL